MARKYNWRAVKIHHSYEYKDAAKALKCSPATIKNWGRDGLPIYADRKPHMIDGEDLRDFAKAKNDNLKWQRPRTDVPWNYFPCLGCKDYRLPFLLMVDAHRRTPSAIDLSGICETCEGQLRKTVSPAQLPQIETTLDVTFRQGRAD